MWLGDFNLITPLSLDNEIFFQFWDLLFLATERNSSPRDFLLIAERCENKFSSWLLFFQNTREPFFVDYTTSLDTFPNFISV